MKIKTELGTEIENPSAADISRAIESLNSPDNGFAILSTDDEVYMQTAGSMMDGFILEYREGSWDSHFETSSRTVSTTEVVKAMQQFAAGDDTWRTAFAWVPHGSKSKSGCVGTASILLLLPILGSIYALW